MRHHGIILLSSLVAITAVAQPYDRPYAGHRPPHRPKPVYGPPKPELKEPYRGPPKPEPFHGPPRPKSGPPEDHPPQKCKPCCTAGFPKRSLGYAPYASYGLAPLENVLLFPPGECPKKTDDLLCEAAVERFAKAGTTYVTKHDYRPYQKAHQQQQHKPGHKIGHYLPPDVKTRYEQHAKQPHVVHAYSYPPTGYSKNHHVVKTPLIINGKWWSDTFADLVIINDACCFNLYPDVYPGDKLKATCENALIGDPSELYKNFRYSVLSPGSSNFDCTFVAGNPECSLPFSAVALGPWYSVTSFNVAEVGVTEGAPATDSVSFFSSIIPFGTAAEEITTNEAGYVGDDVNSRLNPTGIVQDEDFILLNVERVAAQNCALAGVISGLEPNGQATFGGDTLTIDCQEFNANPCVVEALASDINNAATIDIESGSSNQVLINVLDEGGIFTDAEVVVSDSGTPVVFNFHSSTVVLRGPTWTGNVLASKASVVELTDTVTEFSGSLLLGNPLSILRTSGTQTYDQSPNRVIPIPVPEPEITLCTCLCPEEDCHGHY